MADLVELKKDIDKLADKFRDSEKDIYGKIDITNSTVSDLNTSVKLVVDKLSSFIETFKNHDENEMKKYDDILKMFEKTQNETKKLEEKLTNKYMTKDEMREFEKALSENSKAIKQGFKFFYMGSGILLAIVTFGGLIMWILDLISKLQALGVN